MFADTSQFDVVFTNPSLTIDKHISCGERGISDISFAMIKEHSIGVEKMLQRFVDGGGSIEDVILCEQRDFDAGTMRYRLKSWIEPKVVHSCPL